MSESDFEFFGIILRGSFDRWSGGFFDVVIFGFDGDFVIVLRLELDVVAFEVTGGQEIIEFCLFGHLNALGF